MYLVPRNNKRRNVFYTGRTKPLKAAEFLKVQANAVKKSVISDSYLLKLFPTLKEYSSLLDQSNPKDARFHTSLMKQREWFDALLFGEKNIKFHLGMLNNPSFRLILRKDAIKHYCDSIDNDLLYSGWGKAKFLSLLEEHRQSRKFLFTYWLYEKLLQGKEVNLAYAFWVSEPRIVPGVFTEQYDSVHYVAPIYVPDEKTFYYLDFPPKSIEYIEKHYSKTYKVERIRK
jgi:hypothetical protein